jgi:hypothetical protein
MNTCRRHLLRTLLPLLLTLQLCLPFLHICLDGGCGTGAGVHGDHGQHLHDAPATACLQAVGPDCHDIRFDLDPLTSLHPYSRYQLELPALVNSGFDYAGLMITYSAVRQNPAQNPTGFTSPRERRSSILRI